MTLPARLKLMSRSEKRGEDCEKTVQRPDRRRDVAVVNAAAPQLSPRPSEGS